MEWFSTYYQLVWTPLKLGRIDALFHICIASCDYFL